VYWPRIGDMENNRAEEKKLNIAVVKQDTDDDFLPDCGLPWSVFFDTLVREGHKIVSIWSDPDVVVFMNHHEKMLKKLRKKYLKLITVMVIWESPVTRPGDFQAKKLKNYRLILTPTKVWTPDLNYVVFPWPQGQSTYNRKMFDEFTNRDNRAIVFQNNKFSFIQGELYSLRRAIVGEFYQDLIVCGQGWNNSLAILLNLFRGIIQAGKARKSLHFPRNVWVKAPNYLGIIAEKKELLEKFKITIVIENSMDYVSEKLFEALWAGCCVLYVGPNLKEHGLPDLAIQCPPSREAIYQIYLDLLNDEASMNRIRKNAQAYLLSENFQRLRNDNVLRSMAKSISTEVQGFGAV
jgi:hypothetical protein